MYRGSYTLIGQELSMFTRKLEAQLRYQGIPYQWQYKGHENGPAIEARDGRRRDVRELRLEVDRVACLSVHLPIMAERRSQQEHPRDSCPPSLVT